MAIRIAAFLKLRYRSAPLGIPKPNRQRAGPSDLHFPSRPAQTELSLTIKDRYIRIVQFLCALAI